MTDFDVTVVVPTFQGTRYLPACMDSIAAQDLRGVEVLVVDDGSTDETVAIARSYTDRIEHLRVLDGLPRLGAVGNVNRAIEQARGVWIKPVFQDDLIAPDNLHLMRAARHRGVPVVVCGRTYQYEQGVPTWRRDACQRLLDEALTHRFGSRHLARTEVAREALDKAASRLPHLNFVGEPVAVLLERRAVLRAGGFDPGYVQLWDYELVLRLATRRGMILVDEPLATFRVHQESETARNLSGSAYAANVLDRLRLHAAYASGSPYRPVRRAARRQNPPVDLTALAVGVARAGQRLAEELPSDDRAAALTAIDEMAGHLLDVPVWATADAAEVALVQELSTTSEAVPAPAPGHGGEPTAADDSVETAPSSVRPSGPGHMVRAVVRRPGWMLLRVSRSLRTNQWWGHMMGPIVAFACLQMGWRQVPPGEGLGRVVALVVCTVGLAAYGYVVNDSADVVPDRLAGKPNSMARFPRPVRVGIIALLGVLGGLPWLIVPIDGWALAALIGVYVLPLVYSLPPLRLKERDLLGPLADASNAFVLPALFTVALFVPLGEAAGPAPLMVVGAVLWALGFGLRAIVLHQIDDADNDRASGTATLVLRVGAARARQLMRRVLFPMQWGGFVILAATVALWSWGPVAVGVAGAFVFHALRLSGVIDRSTGTVPVDRGGWMYWHQIWPALLVSGALAVGDPWYLALTAFVVVVFWPRVREGAEAIAWGTGWIYRRLAARFVGSG